MVNLFRVPPKLRPRCGLIDLEGIREAAGVSDDVDELCQHLWSKDERILGLQQLGKPEHCGIVTRMLSHFHLDEKRRVDAPIHRAFPPGDRHLGQPAG